MATPPLPSPDTPITLKRATAGAPVGRKTAPTRASLAPWEFEYMPSADGKDANLLIMFHGLGDTKAAFAGLGKQLNLPSTAVLSLQGPKPIPLIPDAWSWYNTYTPTFDPLPNPDPSATLPALRLLLGALTSAAGGAWPLASIHLFGWLQGGTMALELALDVATRPLTLTNNGDGPQKRLGSVVSVCAALESFPAAAVAAQTPACWFTRGTPAPQLEAGLRRAFAALDVVRGEGVGEGMPRGRGEWEGIMRFWGQVLGRGEEGWKGEGEVYEVVQK